MLKKSQITEGDYITLTDNTYCRVSKGWHGKNRSWLEVTYRRKNVPVTRSVELSQIREVSPEPFTDPKNF